MEDIKEIRTATITQKGQICIPNIARNMPGFKEGDKINIIVYNGRVELKPIKKQKMSESMICLLMSQKSLAREWDTPEEDEAWKDL